MVKHSGRSIGMSLLKNLVKVNKLKHRLTEDVLKVMETLDVKMCHSTETETGREDDWTIWIQ